jgi:hypothetical protein
MVKPGIGSQEEKKQPARNLKGRSLWEDGRAWRHLSWNRYTSVKLKNARSRRR